MSDLFTLRARRFHALHDLLTGRLRDHPQPIPTYLVQDVMLPATDTQTDFVRPLDILGRGADR